MWIYRLSTRAFGSAERVFDVGVQPCRWLRELSGYPKLWREQYVRIFGEEPLASLNGPTVRRMCRRSEIKAARWLEAEVEVRTCSEVYLATRGPPGGWRQIKGELMRQEV